MNNLSLTPESISNQFLLPEAREGQLETTLWILQQFASGKKFVLYEGPCGSGKSVIGATISKFFNTAYWVTNGKHLQDQLSKDFGEEGRHAKLLVDLKGRNAYNCPLTLNPNLYKPSEIKKWEDTRPHDCGDGHCRRKGKNFYKECLGGFCPYYAQVDKAQNASLCLMNFSSYLFQTSFTKRFGKRELMILDEAHNTESQLMDFISMTISDSYLPGLQLPVLEQPEEYAKWLIDNNARQLLTDQLNKARIEEDVRRTDDLESIIRKFDHFMEEMGDGRAEDWISEISDKERTTGYRRVSFKPIFVKKYAHKHIFDFADHILLMSATILDVNVMARSLGIDRAHIAAKRMTSTFPPAKRPIFFQPVVKVVGGKAAMINWGPKLIKAVDDITDKHPGQRGIVHTHNFYIAEMLMSGCRNRSRFLFQKDFRNKAEMLQFHGESTDTVLVAPAMHEGLDLKDELCYDSETEILTELGWVRLPDLIENVRVAAYDKATSEIKFEEPLKITRTTSNNWVEFDTMTNNLVVTAPHKMLWHNSQSNTVIETTADSAPVSRHWQFICGGNYESSGVNLTNNQIRLAVAFQADGTWVSDQNTEVRFALRRERKIKRLIELLNASNITHRMLHNHAGDALIMVKKSHFVPLCYLGDWHNDKIWKLGNLLSLSRQQRNALLDELPYWDGAEKSANKLTMVYTSSVPSNIDTIQAVATLSGYRTDYNGHRIQYRKSPYAIFVPGEYNYIKRDYPIAMPCYCVTVSTGWVVVRRHGKVTISGNSRFQIVCKVPFPNQYEDKQLAARMEIDPEYYQWLTALKLVQCVGRSVRSVEDWADTYIIDESFRWWYERNKKLIPAWFKEALKGI